MSDHVLLNLLNNLGKRLQTCQTFDRVFFAKSLIIPQFRSILDFIYHVTLKAL